LDLARTPVWNDRVMPMSTLNAPGPMNALIGTLP
jgi:hypothetical protein